MGAEAGKGLSQFTADGAATENQQTARVVADFPQGLGGQVINLFQPWKGRHQWGGTGGDNDIACGQGLLPFVAGNFHRPRGNQSGATLAAIHPQLAVALD